MVLLMFRSHGLTRNRLPANTSEEYAHNHSLPLAIGFTINDLDCVIGRRGIPLQHAPSNLAKLIIVKPVYSRAVPSRFFLRKDRRPPAIAGSTACALLPEQPITGSTAVIE
jgi:hypothetical protein